jgi:hypothetical protein
MAYDPQYILLAVQSLRPGLEVYIDYELACLDGVNQISVWNRPDIAQPTQAEIEAVDTDPLLAPKTVLPQDLMAQFTADDASAIRAAVDANASFWLLWSAMAAQKDPMTVTNDRFLQGWGALTFVLGPARMAAIAASLGVTIG